MSVRNSGSAEPQTRPLRAGSSHSARSGAAGSWDYYAVGVKRGAKALRVRLAGPGCTSAKCNPDLDLYVRRGKRPTLGDYSCRPRLVGSREACKIKAPKSGRWIVGVHVYAANAPTTYSVSAKVKAKRTKKHRR